jgi:HPt (histidine-containing phosphotransfer) domain-containing protein
VPADADDALAEQFRQLRREYVDESALRIDELRRLRSQLARGDTEALSGLRQAFHRLAGSGGSYGFPLVSSHSRDAELLTERLGASRAPVGPSDLAGIDQGIEAIASAFAAAAREFLSGGDHQS